MNKIGVGFVGSGRISDLHAIGYKDNPDAYIAAVCDSDANTAREAASRWGVDRVFTSLEAILADPAVDAVEILTPQTLHESMAIAALKAGKHVSVQKPMTTSLASADRMASAARKAGKVLKVSENYAFYPPLVLAKKLLDEGAIGEPLTLRIKMMSGVGGWEVPSSAWAWRLREYSDGRGMNTFDHGHHMWASAWYLLGEFDKVSAWIDSLNGVVDSPALVTWKYTHKHRQGQCEFHYGSEFKVPTKYYANDEWFDLSGSGGVMVIRRCTGNLLDGPAVSVYANDKWTDYEVESDWSEGFAGSTRNFIAAIQGRAKAALDAEEARHILAVDLAIAKSDRLRRTVYVEEMDALVPGLYALGRWMAERAGKRAFFAGLAKGRGNRDESIALKARELTLGLSARFDPEAAVGMNGSFGLVLTDDEPDCGTFAVHMAHGCVEIEEGLIPAGSMFVLRTSRLVWASILMGRLRMETAYLTGRLKLEGEATKAIRLRDAFRL
jgi:predicted dehydrogenase